MSAQTLVNLLTIAGLIAIMLSMGFKVTFAEIAAPLRKPRLVISGHLANFVLAPAATAAVLYLFTADPLVSVGFLILAVCPGAPLGPPFAAIAKGDVPYATRCPGIPSETRSRRWKAGMMGRPHLLIDREV